MLGKELGEESGYDQHTLYTWMKFSKKKKVETYLKIAKENTSKISNHCSEGLHIIYVIWWS